MALFDGNKKIDGTRSSTHLVKSGHMSPAEDWMLSPDFKKSELSSVFNDGVLFEYQYGGPGMEDVVIPKGRVVGVGKPVKSFVSNLFKSTMALPGMTPNNNVVGVVPYNITKDYFEMDRFGGNQPSIITLDYITLPYMPGIKASTNMNLTGVADEELRISKQAKMPWGAVIDGEVIEGDYVKATPSGRLTKWVKGTDNPIDVVGQVLASDLNGEPWGWFKWMLFPEESRKEDDAFINRSGASNLPSDNGYPYDPTYTEGNTIFQQYQSQYVTNPTGIEGLHDGSGNYAGYGKNDTEYTGIALGTVPTVTKETQIVVNAKDFAGGDLKNLSEVKEVKIGETVLEANKYAINYPKGEITITCAAEDSTKAITATYKAKHYGTPSYLDFKGVVGALYILLKR